jgi:hypothetical protein
MTDIPGKVAYVRQQARHGAGDHHCHWPGCRAPVAPALWGCKPHWMRLPRDLRTKIWHTYRPGQETTKTPSKEYIAVAREVQEWIDRNTP